VMKRARRFGLIFLILFHVSLSGLFERLVLYLHSLSGSVPGLLQVW
jgi:hypothetical protein